MAAAVPVLVIGQCMYSEFSERDGLESFCKGIQRGTGVKQVLDNAAANKAFKVRTGGTAGKSDSEWFDREYLRLGDYLKKTKNLPGDYSVVFAKPGIGYYACIITQGGALVESAWFEDRSS